MTVKMESPKWLLVASLYLVVIFLCEMILLVSAGQQSVGHNQNSVMPPYNTLSTKEALHRRLMKGREIIPPMISNAIPGEPTCEELRAMWRYYKRQSRAELTNEIPRFGSNPFWDILPGAPPPQPQISSFGPMKGRSKAKLRFKNKSQAYGRVMFKQERERDRERARKPRPMEEVAQLMGKSKADESGRVKSKGGASQEPIVHLSPPPTPTKASSLQQIKEVFREERIKEKGPAMRNNDDNGGKAFGRIILSPPTGMDGRVANKPRELMTPFEKIRFGHADDILDDGTKPNLNLMAKRWTNPLPVLNRKLQQPQQYSPAYYFIPRQLRTDRLMPVDQQQHLIWRSATNSLLPIQQNIDKNPNNLLEMSTLNDDQGTTLDDQFQIDQNNWINFPPSTDQDLQDEDNKSGRKNSFGNNGMIMGTGTYPNRRSFPNQPNLPIMMENPSCSEVEGQPCRENSDCSCVGFGLYRCYVDQCQVISLLPSVGVVEEINSDMVENIPSSSSSSSSPSSSFWHTNPVQRDKLGVWEETPEGFRRLVANSNLNANTNTNTMNSAEMLQDENSQSLNKNDDNSQSLASSDDINMDTADRDSSKSSQTYINPTE